MTTHTPTNKFASLIEKLPVGRTVTRRWAAADRKLLDEAAQIIETHKANPWVFSADARHFWQFAREAELCAWRALTDEQRSALLGWCTEEESDPAYFGY